MSEDSPAPRLSDADREAAVNRLHQAGTEGRLDLGELEERVEAAYASKTDADLEPLLADLPAAPTAGSPTRRTRDRGALIRARTVTFVTPNVICILIWLATGASGSFWPIWVLLGTGIAYITFLSRMFGQGSDRGSPPGP